MKSIKYFSKIISMFMILSFSIQIIFPTYVHAHEESFKITQSGENIIIEENGDKHILKSEEENGKITTYILGENDNIENYFVYDYENEEFYSSITNQYISLEDEDFSTSDENFNVNNLGVRAFSRAGSKENPSRYCTPGSRTNTSSKLSYAQILGMVGAGASATTITTALVARFGLGIKGTTTSVSNIKVVASEAFSVLSSVNDRSWLANHGFVLTFNTVCVLQHYVDNAWGDDEWFYGEQVASVSYRKY